MLDGNPLLRKNSSCGCEREVKLSTGRVCGTSKAQNALAQRDFARTRGSYPRTRNRASSHEQRTHELGLPSAVRCPRTDLGQAAVDVHAPISATTLSQEFMPGTCMPPRRRLRHKAPSAQLWEPTLLLPALNAWFARGRNALACRTYVTRGT